MFLVPGAGVEPAWLIQPQDFKSCVYTSSTTRAWSGKPDSNRRPSPWQGDVLPAELLPHIDIYYSRIREKIKQGLTFIDIFIFEYP